MPENQNFIRYYDEFKDKIYTYFMYRVNFNRAIAEDLTSEVFIKAFKSFDNYDKERSFSTWIYTIAKNHLCNFYRSKKDDVDLENARHICTDLRKQLEIKDELEHVMEKIYSLDEYSREVLVLRFVDGMDNKEIAEMLDKDEGAVRTQISRALKKIRAELI